MILVDFWSLSVPKWLPKRFRRHARRRLLFDGVFVEGFDPLHVFPTNYFFANIAGTLVFTESNAMSPCSPIAASMQLFSQGAIELQLDFGCDLDGKSAANRSKISCESLFLLNSAAESLWAAFWPWFSWFRGAWGPLGTALGRVGEAFGDQKVVPGDVCNLSQRF